MVSMTSMQLRLAGKGLKWLWGKSRIYAISAVVVVGAVNVAYYIKRQQRRKRWNSVGNDVVVLHMFPRGRLCPNLSPFVLKLETYLRMADIPYEVDFEEPLGPKGKSPWITLNGEEVGDSQLIIERLGATYQQDFSAHLTPEQRATARAVRIMMEDHFLWCLAIWRFDVDRGRSLLESIEAPCLLRVCISVVCRKIVAVARLQGMGRHTHAEVRQMGLGDLEAVALMLGDKPYLMGDEPTEVDCSVFGFLAQIMFNSTSSPYMVLLESEHQNLLTYCHRVKDRFWPDWNQCLNPPLPDTV